MLPNLNLSTLFALSGGVTDRSNTASLSPGMERTVLVTASGVQSLVSPATGATARDIYLRLSTTSAAPDASLMPLVAAGAPLPGSFPAYLFASPVSFVETSPGFFPLGVPIDRDVYVADRASASTFATGFITLSPEQISGGADNLAGTTVAISTSSCPEMRTWSLSALQGSVNNSADFKTATLCPVTAVACGFEPRAMIEDNNNLSGFVARTSTPILNTPVGGSTATEGLIDYNGPAGGIPSWQTQPVSISGQLNLAFSTVSAVATVNLLGAWAYVDRVSGRLVIVETAYTTVVTGSGTTSPVVNFADVVMTSPTWTGTPSGFVSVLIGLRYTVQVASSTLSGGPIKGTFSVSYYGRQSSNLENICIIGIVGGYVGRSMLNFSLNYEVQPSVETMPLVRGMQRRAHTSSERDNFLMVRDRIWGISSSYLLLGSGAMSEYVERLTGGDLLADEFRGDIRDFAESPFNGTMTPRYSASTFTDVLGALKRAGITGLGAILRNLADNKVFSASRAYSGAGNGNGRYHASSAAGKGLGYIRVMQPEDEPESTDSKGKPDEKALAEAKRIGAEVAKAVVQSKTRRTRFHASGKGPTRPGSPRLDGGFTTRKRKASVGPEAKGRKAPPARDPVVPIVSTTVVCNPLRLHVDPRVETSKISSFKYNGAQFSGQTGSYFASTADADTPDMEDDDEDDEEDEDEGNPAAGPSPVEGEMADSVEASAISNIKSLGVAFAEVQTAAGIIQKIPVFQDFGAQGSNLRKKGTNFLTGKGTGAVQLFSVLSSQMYAEVPVIGASVFAVYLTMEPLANTSYSTATMRLPATTFDLHVDKMCSLESSQAIATTIADVATTRPVPAGVNIYVSIRGYEPGAEAADLVGDSMSLAVAMAYRGAPTVCSTGAMSGSLTVKPIGDLAIKLAAFTNDSGFRIPFVYPLQPDVDQVNTGFVRCVANLENACEFAASIYGAASFVGATAVTKTQLAAVADVYVVNVKYPAMVSALAFFRENLDGFTDNKAATALYNLTVSSVSTLLKAASLSTADKFQAAVQATQQPNAVKGKAVAYSEGKEYANAVATEIRKYQRKGFNTANITVSDDPPESLSASSDAVWKQIVARELLPVGFKYQDPNDPQKGNKLGSWLPVSKSAKGAASNRVVMSANKNTKLVIRPTVARNKASGQYSVTFTAWATPATTVNSAPAAAPKAKVTSKTVVPSPAVDSAYLANFLNSDDF